MNFKLINDHKDYFWRCSYCRRKAIVHAIGYTRTPNARDVIEKFCHIHLKLLPSIQSFKTHIEYTKTLFYKNSSYKSKRGVRSVVRSLNWRHNAARQKNLPIL